MNHRVSLHLLLLGLMAYTISAATELTAENFDELTAGKVVFIKFLAPW